MAGEWRQTPYGRFAADFVEERLSDLCEEPGGILTGPFGSQLHQEDYVPVGTPIITVEHLGENRIRHEDVPRVSDADRDRLSKYLLRRGDIVFSRVGSVDRRALVRDEEDGWLFSGRCLRVRPDSTKVDSTYLSYFFGLPSFKEHVRSIAVGSTMPSLNTSLLSELVIPHSKDLREQRAIAHILGTLDDELYAKGGECTGMRRVFNHLLSQLISGKWSVAQGEKWLGWIRPIVEPLDDKIELNRRMNETLEAIARALFKSWFVDFDPVRAKCRGDHDGRPRWQRGVGAIHESPLQPGLPAHLADLFPARLVDSELGEIPEGWEVGNLSNLADVVSGKRPHEIFPQATDAATVQLWGGNGPMGCVREPLYSQPALLTGRVGTLGSVFRICEPFWPSDNTLIVFPRDRSVYEYLYFCMKRFDFEALNRGSTQPLLTQTDLMNQRVIISSHEVFSQFHKYQDANWTRIDRITLESRTLAALRDALLPRLISGALRVKDAEKFLQERGL